MTQFAIVWRDTATPSYEKPFSIRYSGIPFLCLAKHKNGYA
jgi:hypothetical protein